MINFTETNDFKGIPFSLFLLPFFVALIAGQEHPQLSSHERERQLNSPSLGSACTFNTSYIKIILQNTFILQLQICPSYAWHFIHLKMNICHLFVWLKFTHLQITCIVPRTTKWGKIQEHRSIAQVIQLRDDFDMETCPQDTIYINRGNH
jgi:hypothetical protein